MVRSTEIQLEYARRVLGEIPQHWNYARIGDLLESGVIERIQDGNHGNDHPKSSDYVPSGVPFVMARDLINGRVDTVNCNFIAKSQADNLRIGFARPGDVLLTHKATMGRVAIVPDGFDYVMLTPQVTFYRIRQNETLDPLYLSLAFRSVRFQHQLNASSDQSTRKYMGITAQRNLWIPLPPIEEQQAIASILGALDDKIESNRRMNATLESLARAIFKSWFVDFDPVKINAGQMPASSAISTTHDPKVLELFPSTFQDSELGQIPDGWSVMPISEAVEINPRRTLARGTVAKYLDMKNVPTEGHRPDDIIDRKMKSGTKFINGDTLMARITPCLENGKTAFVDFLPDGEVGWGSTEFIVLRPRPPLPNEFGYFLARDPDVRQHAIKNMTGTSGRQRVAKECFESYLIAVPIEAVAIEFAKTIEPLMSQIRAASEENAHLSQTRDELLPQLLSGELLVSEANSQSSETELLNNLASVE